MEESPALEVLSDFAAAVDVAGAEQPERDVAPVVERESEEVEAEPGLHQGGTTIRSGRVLVNNSGGREKNDIT